MPPLATVEGEKRHFSQGRIIDLTTGKAIDFPALIDRMEPVDVIFVGEVHDNPEHHLIEVQLLQALMTRYAPPVAVAMEFFDTTRQSVLDRFMEGDLDETAFLKEVDWKNAWRFPYHLYRPLLWISKDKGSALVGINAPNRIVRKVARTGLESLTPEERNQVARDMDLDNKAHRDYLSSIFKQHASGKKPTRGLGNFDYFYQAQCVWDETMAQTIADYMANHMKAHGGKMVVFTGSGHIVNRFGIPERVLRRVDINAATILLYPLTERTTINKKLADYVWLTSDAKTGRTLKRPMKMPPLKTSIKGSTAK
ncbi:conserved hypothetical protein [delta proteobacterium NaphS2]|nr:conserved hypothetical protein [delta proteobacterium NaphS2]